MSFSEELIRARHEKAQRDRRQAAEVEFLSDPKVDFKEYRERRRAKLVVEPNAALDEMDFKDYKFARSKGANESEKLMDIQGPALLDYRKERK